MSSDETSPNDSPRSSANAIPFEDLDCWSSEEEIRSDKERLVERSQRTNEDMEPYIGLEFMSLEEAIQFYESYGGRIGFSVRKQSNTKSKGEMSSKRVVCSKEGWSDRQKHEMGVGTSVILRTPEKERASTRCGCKAYIRFRWLKSGVWQVSQFNNAHNHDFVKSPSKKRNLRSLKGLTHEEEETVLNMRAQNVGVSKIWNYLGERAGGSHCLRFTKKDVSNLLTEQNKALVGVDVETTLSYFRKRQEDDPEFYYAIQPDESGATKNIFWVDGRARRAYLEFGDTVTFDTTYNTNKYSMPVAAFIGVNHHWQSIIFGWCLLRNEKAPNFSWLFATWLAAMYNKPPKSIITDQDPAMKVAIGKIFPTTIHRCCQWHVMRKAREHLGVLYDKIKEFKKELMVVVNRSLTVPDFEKLWSEMINKYNLKGNNYLKVMFSKRAEWVPAYFRDTFFAGMSTTQRSECMNAIMKLWIDGHASIYRFVVQVEKMVEGIWQRESDEDYRTMNETPRCATQSFIELEGRDVYTSTIFRKFRKAMFESTNGVVVEVEKDKLYEVSITCHPDFRNWVPESYKIWVDKPSSGFSCSCKVFEFQGLLCSHALKVMQYLGIQNLPSRYVLKRWSRVANEGIKRSIAERSRDVGDSVELQAMRSASLQTKLLDIVKSASKSEKTYQSFDEDVEKLKEKYAAITNQDDSEELYEAPLSQCKDNSSTLEYRDPPLSQCKGRKKIPKRMKPPTETASKKQRTCGKCNKKGHNQRTCGNEHGKKKRDEDGGSDEEDDNEDQSE